MYAYLATALVSTAVAFGSAWKIQSWRFDAKEMERVNALQEEQRAATARQLEHTKNLVAAQSAAVRRAAGLRARADAAVGELDGLRTQSAAALQTLGANLDACVAGAAAYARLLNQCGKEYQELGERADRHVSDIRTLMDAWPKDANAPEKADP